MTTMRNAGFLTLSLLLSAGCVDTGEEPEVGESAASLYTLSDTVWTTRDIPVCFEPDEPGSSWARALTRDAIEDSWERVADIDFTGWGICASNARGIRIQWEDVGSNTSELGSNLDGVPGGMTLNESFQGEWRHWCLADATTKTSCMRAIAIHEFGHALGFSHEQNRPDTPSSCTASKDKAEDGDTYTTGYDPDSVMNYCAGDRDRLSKLDVTGVRRLYGRKPQDSLVSEGGKCVTTATGSSGWALTDGCEPILGQAFSWLRSSGHLQNGAGQCLDTYGTSYSMYAGGCVNDAYQEFTFDGDELRGWGDHCLDVVYGRTNIPGTPVQALGCTSSTMNQPMNPAQTWKATAAREIRDVSGLCLTADGTANYSDATVRDCYGAASQKWTLADGLIKSDTGRCLAFNTSSGDAFMYDCAGLSAERAWHLAGPIHNRGMCVEVNGASDNGRPLFPTACATGDRQTFDFYF